MVEELVPALVRRALVNNITTHIVLWGIGVHGLFVTTAVDKDALEKLDKSSGKRRVVEINVEPLRPSKSAPITETTEIVR